MKSEMKIIAVANQKGGVGKTTTALHLGAALAERGARVVLIGLDAQRDLSVFGPEMAKHLDNLCFVEGTAAQLAKLCREARRGGAQWVLLDCPPALGAPVAAALKVAHLCIMPVQTELLAARGLSQMMQALRLARDPRRRGGNPHLQARVLLTMAGRDDASRAVESQLRAQLGADIFARTIRRSPIVSASALHGLSALQHAPQSAPARAYRALSKDVVKLLDAKQKAE